MLKSKSTVILLLSFISLFMFVRVESAHSELYTGYETQIFSGSSEVKIRKLQEVFKGLGLYNWEITWKYNDIERVLLDYQLSKWIISHDEDHWAWYFWAKTMSALEADFWELYLNLRDMYLSLDEISTDTRYFQVTAYYSPLPWQQKYTTWSYAWDLKLNWDWHNTASGNWMFAWLLAAPRNYEFGTKIYLEWIWIGEVGDRGWAIVNAGERGHSYDRLDIWVWYGDEWRERARQWGRRDIVWYVVDSSYEVNIEFDESIIAKYASLTIDAENPNPEKVAKLQKLFKEIWLYNWEEDWVWDNIKDIFITWQVDNNVIASKDSSVAWYFWPKTYAKLQDIYGSPSWLFVEKYIDDSSRTNFVDNNDTSNALTQSLTTSQITAMNTVKNALDSKISSMYKWNNEKIAGFKRDFKIALEQIVQMNKYLARRDEFLYLIEIL